MADWCDPCKGCLGKYRAIGGSGPQPASVLLIGERPGDSENRAGHVFVGKTGEELDGLYLPLAGLHREEVRICNTVLCGADNNKTPTDKEIACCAPDHIREEIEMTNPDVIILMGATPCTLVPTVRLELHHGVPQRGRLFDWVGTVIPMYHPAIGLHESRWMKVCMDDWSGLTGLVDCKYYVRSEKEEQVDYQIAGVQEIRRLYSIHRRERRLFACDTEVHRGEAWSVQLSHTPGMGCLVRVSDQPALSELRRLFSSTEAAEVIIFHDAAYDLKVLRRLGIHVRSYRDTMQEAYHLGNLPQGLKPLAYRFFRHTMTSYQETVWPASISALRDWMTEAMLIAQLDLCYRERVKMKTKVKDTVKKGELETLLIRLLRHAEEGGEYDPWERLREFESKNDWMVHHVEARLGPYPVLGIGNCRMEEAIRYAVGDADYTGRVAVELDRRRKRAFQINEGDRDAA